MDGDLNALLNRLLDEAEGSASAEGEPVTEPAVPGGMPTAASAEASSGSSPGAGNSPGGLLANPALLAALPALAENLGPLMGSLSGALSRGTGGTSTAGRSHHADRHTALLCAIKPYLSDRRRDAAETVIRLCRVWDALEKSGVSLSGLLGGMGGGGAPSDREVT